MTVTFIHLTILSEDWIKKCIEPLLEPWITYGCTEIQRERLLLRSRITLKPSCKVYPHCRPLFKMYCKSPATFLLLKTSVPIRVHRSYQQIGISMKAGGCLACMLPLLPIFYQILIVAEKGPSRNLFEGTKSSGLASREERVQ